MKCLVVREMEYSFNDRYPDSEDDDPNCCTFPFAAPPSVFTRERLVSIGEDIGEECADP